MEDPPFQTENTALDKTASVVLDIDSLAQPTDRSSGSPKMTRPLSRKWSNRAERWPEEEDMDEPAKKLLLKVNSQLEPLKQPLLSTKALAPATAASGCVNLLDNVDGRNKRFNRLMGINPRKILFIFATVSSVGTLILIYFTLAINGTI